MKLKYIILSIILIFTLFACDENKQQHAEETATEHEHDEEEVHLSQQQFESLKMKKDTLAYRNITDYVSTNGTLEVPPQSKAMIPSMVGANVTSISVIEGDNIKKGQVLAYLSHPTIISTQTDYLNAFSNSSLLKKKYERQKKLYEAGVGSGANFQKATAEYQASKSLIKGLEAQLHLMNINPMSIRDGVVVEQIALRSPISGFVQKVNVTIGQYVDQQTEMFQVVNTDKIHADLMVFEKDAYKVKKGQKVTFYMESDTDEILIGEVHSVGKIFETNPKAIRVHTDIENKHKDLIPGVFVKGKIHIGMEKSAALPESAIVKDGDKAYVFSVEKEGEEWSFKPIEVILGKQDDDWIALSFLEEIPKNTEFAYNNAYYLLAEMKKGETEHSH